MPVPLRRGNSPRTRPRSRRCQLPASVPPQHRQLYRELALHRQELSKPPLRLPDSPPLVPHARTSPRDCCICMRENTPPSAFVNAASIAKLSKRCGPAGGIYNNRAQTSGRLVTNSSIRPNRGQADGAFPVSATAHYHASPTMPRPARKYVRIGSQELVCDPSERSQIQFEYFDYISAVGSKQT